MNQCISNICIKDCQTFTLYPVLAEPLPGRPLTSGHGGLEISSNKLEERSRLCLYPMATTTATLPETQLFSGYGLELAKLLLEDKQIH